MGHSFFMFFPPPGSKAMESVTIRFNIGSLLEAF